MADAPATFVWTGDALVERDLRPHDRLLVADSWLVSADGRTRALDAHRERFLAGIEESAGGASAAASGTGSSAGHTDAAAEAFWSAALGRLRSFRSGPLFPRVELAAVDGTEELRLRVRVAPRRRESTVLATHAGPEPRRVPRVKGPDLERLLALRAGAQENGADELVLLDDGLVSDGTSSAVLWWRGETLVAPASDLARVASVTARSIRLIATATGTRVVEERARPGDLDGCEVWVVSALHGISVVDAWIDGPVVVARPSRAATWRKRLEALSRPL
ncbi:aminotransferase class IV [Herbiconiux daphne]|uniref:Aminotransferase class IV n=1 Tax=Herbiconiux daphne TaxID=2970914 RepID=A0ABT2GZ33_9MICO|nr:aminotransferase class IV [Herbiconiux daphne]MCS5733126.1 aminotransferase class IV [Herbiconiux daphne]